VKTKPTGTLITDGLNVQSGQVFQTIAEV